MPATMPFIAIRPELRNTLNWKTTKEAVLSRTTWYMNVHVVASKEPTMFSLRIVDTFITIREFVEERGRGKGKGESAFEMMTDRNISQHIFVCKSDRLKKRKLWKVCLRHFMNL